MAVEYLFYRQTLLNYLPIVGGPTVESVLNARAAEGYRVHSILATTATLIHVLFVRGEDKLAVTVSPTVNVDAPVVHVAAPVVNVEAPLVRVDAPIISVEAPVVHVAAPVVHSGTNEIHVAPSESVVNVAPEVVVAPSVSKAQPPRQAPKMPVRLFQR